MRRADRRTAMLDVCLRALLRIVLLDVFLNLAADERARSGACRRRQIVIADVLADSAADHGAHRGAGDRVLVLRVELHGDFFVPALLCRRSRRGCRTRCALRARGRSRLSDATVPCSLRLPRNW